MTTVTANDFRQQMISLYEKGQTHEFLSHAQTYLAVVRDDHDICLRAIQGYLTLGLTVVAVELLDEAIATSSAPPELQSIRNSLSDIVHDQPNWDRHRSRFEANLSTLNDRDIDTSLIQSAWAQYKNDYQLLVDSAGTEHVRFRESTSEWKWFPFFGDHRVLASHTNLPSDIKALQPGPYAFEGLGTGHYFERIANDTFDTFLGYSCPLYVVETKPELLALLFHLHDWTKILSDQRMQLFWGPNAAADFFEALDSNFNLPLPANVFTLCAAKLTDNPLADQVSEFSAKRQDAIIASHKKLQALYQDFDLSYWSARFDAALCEKGKPLRILSMISTHTSFLKHSLRDAKKALESLGHQCTVLTEHRHYEHIGPLTIHQAIKEHQPDLMLILDHLRPEFGYVLPDNLPMLTWDQDMLPHVFTKNNVAGMAPIDFLAGYAVQQCMELGANPRQLHYASVPTCPTRFSGSELTIEERARYACDVSFVSHASQTAKAFHDEERKNYTDPTLARFLDTLFELLPQYLTRDHSVHGALTTAVLKEAMQQCGIATIDQALRQRLTGWYLWRLGDRLFRHQALEWIAKWAKESNRQLRIYGNGWDNHPTLSEFATGPAENGRELLCIYRATKINLQLMPAGFIHQRALDGLAGGGFFLARWTHGDWTGPSLRRVARYLAEHDLTNNRSLLNCQNQQVQADLRIMLNGFWDSVNLDSDDLIYGIQNTAMLATPRDVFSDFEQIAFDSAETFVNKADSFLADADHRLRISQNMRSVVVKQFSYKAAMDSFLHAHADYLREAKP